MDTTCEWRSRVPSLQPQIFGPKPRKPNLQHLPRTSPLPNPGLDLLRRQQEPLEPLQKAKTKLKPSSNFTYCSGPQVGSATVSKTVLVRLIVVFYLFGGPLPSPITGAQDVHMTHAHHRCHHQSPCSNEARLSRLRAHRGWPIAAAAAGGRSHL